MQITLKVIQNFIKMLKYKNIEIYLIPIFSDNYVFIAKCLKSSLVFCIDPGSFAEIDEFLEKKGWKLDYILNTHHHWDHISGNLELKEKYNCQIIGNEKDASRITGIDIKVKEGDIFQIGEIELKVMAVDGHTVGHIAYFIEKQKILFIGDTLFSCGCGRLFEGSYQQMFDSLQKLKSLPLETQIYCAHEYTLDNINFALSIEPNNQDLQQKLIDCQKLRNKNLPTIPTNLANELKTNPFLRAENVEEFTRARKLKDNW